MHQVCCFLNKIINPQSVFLNKFIYNFHSLADLCPTYEATFTRSSEQTFTNTRLSFLSAHPALTAPGPQCVPHCFPVSVWSASRPRIDRFFSNRNDTLTPKSGLTHWKMSQCHRVAGGTACEKNASNIMCVLVHAWSLTTSFYFSHPSSKWSQPGFSSVIVGTCSQFWHPVCLSHYCAHVKHLQLKALEAEISYCLS